jgi:hypothetical protein
LEFSDKDPEKQVAIDLFNHVWSLLEMESRSPEQDDEMIHAAHASRYHWGRVGTALNCTRGEWQISRVYAVLGRGEPALFHARRCLALTTENGFGDFDLAYAYEALARASAVSGDQHAAIRYAEQARVVTEDVEDTDDRDLVLADIATLPV